MSSKIEDAEGKSALQDFLREIIIGEEGDGTFIGTRKDNTNEEVAIRLFSTREWKTYRDAPRIDPTPEKQIRQIFIDKAFDLSFLSIDTGGPILATPRVSAPITVLYELGRKEEAKQLADSIKKDKGCTIKFTAEEMQKVRKFVTEYGTRKNTPPGIV